jgi:O-antigen ligase
VTETLQVTGTIAAAGLAGASLLLASPRWRLAALSSALIVAVALVAGQAWDGPLEELRDSPAELALVAAGALAALAALALAFRRWPLAFPLAALAALPVRIPVDLGGESSNLLLPLYAVIGAGILASLLDFRSGGPEPPFPVPRLLALALAAAVALYGLQTAYSNDVEFAARNVAFFLVPFAALFVLLVETEWTPRLLLAAVAVLAGEAILFALVGTVQHQLGEIFWNDALQSSNDFHFYFRSNSVFFDPNVYGRYLSLAIVLMVAVLAWTGDGRRAGGLALAIAVTWVGLLFGFSQTSFLALLTGLLVLGALRWSLRWALLAAPVVAAAAAIAVLANASDEGVRSAGQNASSGRTTLIEGGLELAADRPLHGHGSASFPIAFREQEDIAAGKTTVSHNEPVTVAAEQGLVGLLAYGGLIAAALWTLFGGLRNLAPGLGGRLDPSTGRGVLAIGRIAVAAGFCALLVHTIGYAGYLTDPLTWSLIAIGAVLAPMPDPRSG